MAARKQDVASCQLGSVQVEQLVLVAMVALGFAAAVAGLGAVLLEHHQVVETVFTLPIP